jgi:casein kinase II subunit alpha
VAIKVYKFDKLKMPRMLQEIRINQNLCHPNIAKLLHVVKQELTTYPALVFEYISDQTLDHVKQGVSAQVTKLYATQLLRGLAHAHERGVVHRDIKPSNVVVDTRAQLLQIIDWGLSGIFKEGNRGPCCLPLHRGNLVHLLTKTVSPCAPDDGSIAGSLHYKAPEVLLGFTHPTPQSDMWSFGCILAAMLFGESTVFYGANTMNQLHIVARVRSNCVEAYTRLCNPLHFDSRRSARTDWSS